MKRLKWVAAVAAIGLVMAGCSSDDDDAADATTTTEAPTDAGTDGETITVTAIDYSYTGLPAEVAAGTTLVLQNDSEGEVHEILAFRLADDETRPIADLMALPEAELGPVLGGPPIVALASPGAASTALPTPPATLAEPGRYVIACFIPAEAPPADVMQAVQDYLAAGGEDPAGPAYPETGPPHAAIGMFAEVTVTA